LKKFTSYNIRWPIFATTITKVCQKLEKVLTQTKIKSSQQNKEGSQHNKKIKVEPILSKHHKVFDIVQIKASVETNKRFSKK